MAAKQPVAKAIGFRCCYCRAHMLPPDLPPDAGTCVATVALHYIDTDTRRPRKKHLLCLPPL